MGVKINDTSFYHTNTLYYLDDFLIWGDNKLKFEDIRTAENIIYEEVGKIKKKQGS
jgi:hypothetical protein